MSAFKAAFSCIIVTLLISISLSNGAQDFFDSDNYMNEISDFVTQQSKSASDSLERSPLSDPPRLTRHIGDRFRARVPRRVARASSMPQSPSFIQQSNDPLAMFKLLEPKEKVRKPETGPFGEVISDGENSAPAPTTISTTRISTDRFQSPVFAEVLDQMKEITNTPHPDESIANHHRAMRMHRVVGRPQVSPPMSPPPPPTNELPPPMHASMNFGSLHGPEMPLPTSMRSGSVLMETKSQTHVQAQTHTQAQAKTMSVSAIRTMLQQQQRQHALRVSRPVTVPPPVAMAADNAPAHAAWRKY